MLLKLWISLLKLHILSILLLARTGIRYIFIKEDFWLSQFLFSRSDIYTIIKSLNKPSDFCYGGGNAFSSQESVVKRGEGLLKKKALGVSLDDANLIGRLFLLFNGTSHPFFSCCDYKHLFTIFFEKFYKGNKDMVGVELMSMLLMLLHASILYIHLRLIWHILFLVLIASDVKVVYCFWWFQVNFTLQK